MRICQIAAGDGARNYTKLYLEHDIMLIGPGNPGSFVENKLPITQSTQACRKQWPIRSKISERTLWPGKYYFAKAKEAKR